MEGSWRVLAWSLGVLAAVTSAGCTTTSGSVNIAGRDPSHYQLRAEAPTPQSYPLPTAIPIYVDWEYGATESISELGFYAWDLDGDGRTDMIQALDSEGKVIDSLFDFDGNGVAELRAGAR